MATLTNAQVISIINNLNSASELVENEFPIKFAWGFQKNVKAISDLSTMINDKLVALDNKYADDEHSEEVERTDENGNTFTQRVVKTEFMEEFKKEKLDFLQLENEVTIQKFNIDDLGDIKVSLATINALDFMIE